MWNTNALLCACRRENDAGQEEDVSDILQLSHPLYCLFPILTGTNMDDPPDTIKLVNSDMKGYDKKLVRRSNIPLDYIVDNKLGHYWYKYVTRDVL